MTFAADPSKRPAAAEVVKEFKANKIEPEGYVLYTYAAVQIWADAVKKAGTADPKKVADTLKSSGPWQSVLGPITFDKKGDPTQSGYVLLRLEEWRLRRNVRATEYRSSWPVPARPAMAMRRSTYTSGPIRWPSCP